MVDKNGRDIDFVAFVNYFLPYPLSFMMTPR